MNEFIAPAKLTFDSLSNGEDLSAWDSVISSNPQEYYDKRKNLFYERKGEILT